MLIFLIVIGALSVGLIAGSATARIGYTLDPDVRNATRSLEEAKERWQKAKAEFEPLQRHDSGFYDAQERFTRSVENLKNQRAYATNTYQKSRTGWMIGGGTMILLWPVGIALGLVAGVGFVIYKLGSKAIMYALAPAQFDEHSELLKGTMQ